MSSSSGKRFVISIVILIVVVVAAFLVFKPKNTAPPPAHILIDATGQPTTGNPKAPLHIIAFEDLKCANCRRYNMSVYPKIKANYINTHRAQYTVIPLSFLPSSAPAGNAALCLYHQKPSFFFDFVEYVYLHQPPESTNWATLSALLQMANQSTPSADMNALSHCMMNNKYVNQLANNLKIAQSIMHHGVQTPSVYVNGVLVRPLTFEHFNQIANHAKG